MKKNTPKPAPRKASSRKPAPKARVRKSRAKPAAAALDLTGSEIAARHDHVTDFGSLTPAGRQAWRAAAISQRDAEPGKIEFQPSPPTLSNEDLNAVQRLLDSGRCLEIDAAVAKVRELRYGYLTGNWGVMHAAADATLADSQRMLDQLANSCSSAANLSASVSWNGAASDTAAAPLTAYDQLGDLSTQADRVGDELDAVMAMLDPVLRNLVATYDSRVNGPAVEAAEPSSSPAAYRVQCVQRRLTKLRHTLEELRQTLDLPAVVRANDTKGKA